MQQRALVLALFTAGTVLPASPVAAEDCVQMFVYAVNQVCRTLANGFSQCQPVGVVGPAPNCSVPGVPPVVAVPLAPPSLPTPPAFAYQPYAGPVVPYFTAPVTAAPALPPVPVNPMAPAPAVTPSAKVPVATASAPSGTAVVEAPGPKADPGAASVQVAAPAATPAMPVAVPESAPTVAKAGTEPASGKDAAATPAKKPAAAKAPVTYPAQLVIQDGIAHFDFDRAELTAEARAELDAWLKQPLPKGKSLRVTGHADRLGPAPYNMKLSGRRALTVKKYLEGKGVAGKDIQVVAKGESEPVKQCPGEATAATIACLAPNRRVEVGPE